MSFLTELNTKKNSLKPTQTSVTYVDGTCYIETRSSTLPTKTKTYGYIVDNEPDDVPAKIVDHLYLGSQDCCTKQVFEKHNIVNVLSLGIKPSLTINDISYNYIECLDLPETNIWEVIERSVPIIRSSVNKCENILVHCNAGISRSPSIVIGYLILEHNFDFNKAFEYVLSSRSTIKPNNGFLKQLLNF